MSRDDVHTTMSVQSPDMELSHAHLRPEEVAAADEWDRYMLHAHSTIFTAEPSVRFLTFSFTTAPEFVKRRIRDAILGGALFSDFEGISGNALMELREVFADKLTEDGWTIDEMRDELMEFQPDLTEAEAERIARTETASVVNTARETGYREKGISDERFYWSGVLDERTTDACRWLVEKTNPFEGGTPVPLEELQELIDEAPSHDSKMKNNLARPQDFVVHPNERKTFVRYVEGMV